MNLKEKTKDYLPEFIVCLWILAVIASYYPGVYYILPDFNSQFQQAIAGAYNDHHPPIMAFLLRQLLFTGIAPTILFLLHVTFFGAGFYFIIKSLQKIADSYKWCVLAIFFALPPVVSIHDVLKDNGMMSGLFFFIGVILYHKNIRSHYLRYLLLFLALIALFYGTAIRTNAILAIPAIAFGVILLLLPSYKLFSKIVISSILTILLFSATQFFNYGVCHARKTEIIRYSMLADIVAIDSLSNERTPYLDSVFSKGFLDSYHYNYVLTGNADPLYFTPYIFNVKKKDIQPIWIQRIKDHPFLWMKAHAKFALDFLVSPKLLSSIGVFHYPAHLPIRNTFDIPFRLFLYIWGAIYFVVCLKRFFFAYQNDDENMNVNTVKCILLGSGLGLYSTFILFATANPDRYIQYTTFMILFVLCLCLLEICLNLNTKIKSYLKKILLLFIFLLFFSSFFFSLFTSYLIRIRSTEENKFINIEYILKIGNYNLILSNLITPLKSITGNLPNPSNLSNDIGIWKMLPPFGYPVFCYGSYANPDDEFPTDLEAFNPLKNDIYFKRDSCIIQK